jgi:hypothetical protein
MIRFLRKILNRALIFNLNQIKIYIIRGIFKADVKTKFRFRSNIVLSSNFGGLGDNLQLSSLPEEFWKQFRRSTYISGKSNHRNDEIFDLVWKSNPYVLGVSNKRPIAGDLTAWRSLKNPKITNVISHWEFTHGLNVTNEFPKIYYTPKKIDELKNTVLIDLSSITLFPSPGANTVNSYNPELLKMAINHQLKNYSNYELVKVLFNNDLNKKNSSAKVIDMILADYEIRDVQVESIFDYVDLMASCSAIVTIYSGAAVLASSIKKYNPDLQIFTFITHQNYFHEMNNPNYIFNNINYVKY